MHGGRPGSRRGFAVDASIVKADANRRRGVPSEEGIDWSNPELWIAPAEAVVRTSAAIKSHQGAPIFTHPLHHPANATLFPAKSAQEPIESPVFL
jgi:hypothetical protein